MTALFQLTIYNMVHFLHQKFLLVDAKIWKGVHIRLLLKFNGYHLQASIPIGPLWMLHMPGPSVHPKPKIDTSCKDPTINMDEEETAKYILG